jgi:hypothetical protein
MIDMTMQRVAATMGSAGTQEPGGTVVVAASAINMEGTELTAQTTAQVARVVRFGTTMDAVAAGDHVVDRFLTSLRKLAER